MKKRIKVITIVGPTGIGKTNLSLELADRLANVEIISADSRQVYKFMDIGTAKPSAAELARVNHHFINTIYPNEYFSAGKYSREAREKIIWLIQNNRIPMVVGGSGLYIRALFDGFFEKEITDISIKKRLNKEMAETGIKPLYEKLCQLDPPSAEKIHPNNVHRIVRALEVYEITGVPLSEYHNEKTVPAPFDPLFIGLNIDRQQLYRQIEKRVDRMLEIGLVDEVKTLKNLGYQRTLNSQQTVGYREVFEYLEGELNYEEMERLIKQRSRNYAKRQLTWFGKEKRINWFDLESYKNFAEMVEKIFDFICKNLK